MEWQSYDITPEIAESDKIPIMGQYQLHSLYLTPGY